jgi:hypothetical protein
MERTQIYLTARERAALRAIARHLGGSQSAVIRMAIDRFINHEDPHRRRELMHGAAGLWKDRRDLPDVPGLRRELDRLAGK